jgi:hypothetical protein
MKFEIKSRFNASVLFTLETESLKLCVKAAVKAKANLYGADLSGADLSSVDLSGADLSGADLSSVDLSGANLYGADLSGADLSGAFLQIGEKKLTLVGERPLLSISNLGSRNATLLAFITDGGVYVRTGCFFDTISKFSAAVKNTHGASVHQKQYSLAVSLIKHHARVWK